MVVGEINWTSSSIFASAFKAFSNAAEEAPSKVLVLPVTIRPSGSSIATAGSPVVSALTFAALITGDSSLDVAEEPSIISSGLEKIDKSSGEAKCADRAAGDPEASDEKKGGKE